MSKIHGCGCDCCIHNNDGDCTCESVKIDFDYTACGFIPTCTSYEEKGDAE